MIHVSVDQVKNIKTAVVNKIGEVMKVIEFNGDPMLQLEKYDELDNYVFYLNQESMNEISSYSTEVEEVPQFFKNIIPNFVLLAEGGIDEEGNEFPDTYIGIQVLDTPNQYKIAGIYASDIEYSAPSQGEEILLKKSSENIKK